ncbi:hypothetical protein AJ80_09740 [Polytolypa hystricis UAMH7299]|uniref:Uncharacterized protein n=1 Tax=Polytolypa hystricis (strain UAMH7299) TaxID=1447883 RepID=A0A2B7WKQ9_POLH7|nr:hypothetical protein AJ80_09740 [Polytolypa hystricis UAMH7299]
MSTTQPSPTDSDLITPTIKAEVYTTGRGGLGNMVANNDPELARVRQDVDVPPPVAKGKGEEGKFHLGRGGAANVYAPPVGDGVEKGLGAQESQDTLERTKSAPTSSQRSK